LFHLSFLETRADALSPLLYINELRLSNRGLLIPSWQNAMLIKRLSIKLSRLPTPSQFKAKNFSNLSLLSASYARPKSSLRSPSLKPFGKQPVKQPGEISFALLSALNVFLCQGDGICGIALWLP